MEITLGERQVSADRPFPCSSSSGALVADPPEDLIRRLQDVVLISGETGTGKELVASAIRYLGERGASPSFR